MDNKRQMIYLAALLHDIGKFYQRGDKITQTIISDTLHTA